MMDENDIFREDIFYQFSGKNTDETLSMANLFIEQVTEYLKEFQFTYINYTPEAWHDIAHKTKGLCAFAGAERLRQECAKAQDMENASFDDITKQMDIITSEVHLACDAVQNFINRLNKEGII